MSDGERREDLVLGDGALAAEVRAEPGGEQLLACMACGTCSAGCPVREVVPEFDPRAIVRLVLLDAEEVLAGDLVWLCALCATCDERCPQGVRLPALITAIRNVAVRRGLVPAAMAAQVGLLRDYGRLLEVEEHNKRRAKIGLPELRNPADATARILRAAGLCRDEEGEGSR
jgi:heterodisulfide reductase subunit C